MSNHPLAYHITFGTYGTRLHGDERGTVDRKHNMPGEPIIGQNTPWRRAEEKSLKQPPIVLTLEQRLHGQSVMPAICERGGWEFHVAACQPDHVYVLLSSQAVGSSVRRWLKVWLGNSLSGRWPLPNGRPWWAEGGSVKWIWHEDHLERAIEYVKKQQAVAEARDVCLE